jgi:hypothetical protein
MMSVEIVSRSGEGRGGGKRGEFDWGTLYAYMELSQRNPFV